MARTAPVPNLPPIPGMCPSIAVMGGGGAGGGGSGNGAGGGDAGANGDGDGTGAGANADGSSAAGCGGGSAGTSCSRCNPNVVAGDPVEVGTGSVFTIPELELVLPGPHPLEMYRGYHAGGRRFDVGIGAGWGHSLLWRIHAHRTELLIHGQSGNVVRMPVPAPGESSVSKQGWLVRRRGDTLSLDAKDNRWRIFEPSEHDPGVYLLVAIEDFHGNRISLGYERGRLAAVTDSVGRELRVSTTHEGRVASISVANASARGSWVPVVRYSYDPGGRLVHVEHVEGGVHQYAYDPRGRLVRAQDPVGLTSHWVYDEHDRCVESWIEAADAGQLGLFEGAPKVLADGVTRAKGIHHVRLDYGPDGYVEVADSVQVQRFFGNDLGKIDKAVSKGGVTTRSYDARGNVLEVEDPLGNLTTYARDHRGRVLEHTDPMGRTISFQRDEWGRLTGVVDAAGHEWTVQRDDVARWEAIRDPEGNVTVWRFDERGQLIEQANPDGTTRRLTRDGHGNVIGASHPNGDTTTLTYDWLGRCVAQVDSLGRQLAASYTPAGRMASLRTGEGAWYAEYDSVGQIRRFVDEDGRVHRYVWGHYRKLLEHHQPDGSVVRRRYDREGRLRAIENEVGERYEIVPDVMGLPVEERTFDGRVLRNRYDSFGRRTLATDANGRSSKFEYDASGRTTKVEFHDGCAIECEYDERGLLKSAAFGSSSVSYERTALGRIAKEVQTHADETVEVSYTYDAMGRVQTRSSSWGHAMRVTRGGRAEVQSMLLDASEVSFERDSAGRELRRRLPDGGTISIELDVMDRVRRVMVDDAAGGRAADTRFRITPGGNVVEHDDQSNGAVGFSYDLRQRLIESIPAGGERRQYRYRENGDLYEAGAQAPSRAYEPGGRLVRRGDVNFEYGPDGRLSVKRVRRGHREEVQRYRWDSRGLLAEVHTFTGASVRFTYDAFGRRVEKRLVDGAISRRTRYVWDGDSLLHARTSELVQGVGWVDRVLDSYCFEGGGVPRPFAKKRQLPTDDVGTAKPWEFFVTDLAGAPLHRVSGGGRVAETSARGDWSADEGTELGFSGQLFDPETGLYYNRWRYYDPETGRYTAPDPIGLLGGLSAYQYGVNPISWVDPLGLAPGDSVVTATLRLAHPAGGATPIINPATGTAAFPNTGGAPEQHSEAHLLNQLREMQENGTNLQGSVLEVSGSYHACPSCSRALADFARENNMAIQYRGSGGTSDLMLREDHRSPADRAITGPLPTPPRSRPMTRDDYERERQRRVEYARRR